MNARDRITVLVLTIALLCAANVVTAWGAWQLAQRAIASSPALGAPMKIHDRHPAMNAGATSERQ